MSFYAPESAGSKWSFMLKWLTQSITLKQIIVWDIYAPNVAKV